MDSREVKTLHYAGQGGEGWGWGTANTNLKRELGQHFNLTDDIYGDVVFMPLADHAFSPVSNARGLRNVAYTFFEFQLQPEARENAKRYDVVFAGSSWCLERMREAGIENGKLLIQGVDQTIFRPNGGKPNGGRLFIFSGGKFEYRKGQDLVIAAFRHFARQHPEAHLVCAWNNPWFTQLAGSMRQSPHIVFEARGQTQVEWYESLLINNGLTYDQFTVLPPLPQAQLAAVMNSCDAGLFPNRCEGGTNLVLMEFLSCGRPAAANLLTGHADLKGADIEPIRAHYDAMHWAEQSVEDIVSALNRTRAPKSLSHIPQWSWADAAQTVADTINSL